MSCGGVKVWYNNMTKKQLYLAYSHGKGMDVMKKKHMLATLVMLSLLQGSVYAADPEVNNIYYGNGNPVIIDESFTDDYISIIGSGSETATGNITGGNITVNGGDMDSVYGAAGSGNAVISNNMVTVNVGGMSEIEVSEIAGGYSYGDDPYKRSEVKNNIVKIGKGSLNEGSLNVGSICGGGAEGGVVVDEVDGDIYFTVSNNRVFDNYVLIDNANLHSTAVTGTILGGYANFGSVFNNHVEINGGTFDDFNIYGGCVPGIDGNVYGNSVTINEVKARDEDNIIVYGGYAENGNVNKNIVNIYNSEIPGGFGGFVEVDAEIEHAYEVSGNVVVIKKAKVYEAVGGFCYNKNYKPDAAKVHDNYVVVGTGGNVILNLVGGGVAGAPADVINNKIILCENSTVTGTVIAGGSDNIESEISGNSINLLQKADVTGADLYGYKRKTNNTYNNNLVIDKGWTGAANSVQNFNNIKFNNLVWNTDENAAVLTTNRGSLDGTNVSFTLQSGQKVNVGESMTLISSSTDLGTIANNGQSLNTTMGVAADVSATLEQTGNKVMATVDNIELNDQTMLVAENRAVAAAFINQGTDLIADSLDTLSRDSKYGVKTFAAVHGNRSKYDVNSDIKINGWSTIVGVGSETEHNGGDFSWGVFYENGSGNYRTFNSFNNEFFRGDGSLVYNGGGIAARYENAHGVYTEGSLRAGMLKSDMDNALSDGENKYGYSSESEYYGAHIGIGQIIPLSESSDLDVYGKFFHTYTEGDSFKVDTDEFEFDSINSDRLRVGARLTTNKENKFSTYYGLAYEYEFNGDAEMRAAGMSAPMQSLQGSSYMAEVGFNYQPTPESPWSFDLNMRGYAGEREGATFNVQATYTF